MVYITNNNNNNNNNNDRWRNNNSNTNPNTTTTTTSSSSSLPSSSAGMHAYASTYYNNTNTTNTSASTTHGNYYNYNSNINNAALLGVTNVNNNNGSSGLSPNTNLGLRKRDGIAILTCLFLLRLAFTPAHSETSNLLTSGFGDASISASLELAFYAPFRSRPPNNKQAVVGGGGGGGVMEKTARPVPLDIDGDGVVEAMVVPVFLKRGDVLEEVKNGLILSSSSSMDGKYYKRKGNNNDANAAEDTTTTTTINKQQQQLTSGWSDAGSWGLRILNLKPLHNRREDGTTSSSSSSNGGDDELIAGPFAPRTMFLSPLVRYSTKQQELERNNDNSDNTNDRSSSTTTTTTTTTTYPLKLLSIQIPIQRTQLGEEEKSRQRHKKNDSSSSGSSYDKGSGPPPKDDPHHSKNYDRTRHYFCGRDWHHASQSCHKHCPSGINSECGEGETCYADTPCDALLGPDGDTPSGNSDTKNNEDKTKMALTPRGTLPGIITVWSDGSVSLHVITADVASSSSSGTNKSGNSDAVGDGKQPPHRAKRARQKTKKPELEMRQLWRVYPLEPRPDGGSNNDGTDATMAAGEGSEVYFDELGVTFESGAIYGVATTTSLGEDGNKETKKSRIGDYGAILVGGRYTLVSKDGQEHPLKVSFHALDSLTGAPLWELKGSHGGDRKDSKKSHDANNGPRVPIIHTTSSARRRSHLPATDMMDPDLDNENEFIEGDDVMTSEECMTHFRASVLDGDSGALPHEFWGDGQDGSISVGRFDRTKRSGGRRGRAQGKKARYLAQNKVGGVGGNRADGTASSGAQVIGGGRGGAGGTNRGGTANGKSWQSDLMHRAVPNRLINKQRYNAKHPRMGKPNVVLFHGSDGLAVLSLKNGRPVCHISLMDHALYADIDQDGVIDIVQVVTSPEGFSKSSGVQTLIQRIAKSGGLPTEDEDNIDKKGRRAMPDTPVICHALVMSGLPPREEVFTAPLCLGGPLMSISPNRPQRGLSAAAPLLVEGSLGYGNDVVFAMNNGVVVRYDSNGREVWRKRGGLSDGTPSWGVGQLAFLGRIEFGSVRELHTSVSASSHRNQHRPGSPARPILLSGEDGAAVVSPASGRVLCSIVYPQSVTSQPLLADLNGDGTDDLLVVSSDAIWGYRVVVETGRSGFFSLVVVTVLIGVAFAALVHKTTQPPGRLRRSMDA